MTDTIKSVTTCPTCGGECEVKGNTRHYYVSKTEQLRKEKDEALRLLNAALKLIHSLPDLIGDSLGEQAKQLVKFEIDKALK